jgi:hypothetical protein
MEGFPSYEKFLKLYDSNAKRYLQWNNIDSNKLQSFMTKELKIHLFVYSTNVTSKAEFDIAKRTLIDPALPDRAGAAANSEMDIMVQTLKSKHSDVFEAAHTIWGLWATDILRKPRHTHSFLVENGPPSSLIRLFRLRSTPAETVLQNLQHVNLIGLDMVRTLLLDISPIKQR